MHTAMAASGKWGSLLAFGLLSAGTLLSPCALAQSVTPIKEYRKLVTASQSVQPLATQPFGESINLYNGSLSFAMTDVSIPGPGLALNLTRSLETANSGFHENLDRKLAFGDWELEVPRIETESAYQSNVTGWYVGSYGTSGYLSRCTYFRPPPPVSSSTGADPWEPSQWWHRYHLVVPGYGDQMLLSAPAKKPSSGAWVAGTKQGWVVGCGVTATDGGEGFSVLAPDGTRYTFSQLVYRPETSLTSPLGTGPMASVQPHLSPFNVLKRRKALMYATRVQDRFGNTLTYNWSDNSGTTVLSSIVASDGRQLNFIYAAGSPLVQTVTAVAFNGAPTRTWTYTYSKPGVESTLTKVTLPDLSAWTYNLGNLQTASLETDGAICPNGTPVTMSSTVATGSMTAPSGLTATFTMTPTLHGRSYVPLQCVGLPGSSITNPVIPSTYAQFSLTQEVLSGPGIPTATWKWSYSAPNQSWLSDACAKAKTCVASVYTDVTDPALNTVRHTFSNRFDASEGALLRTDAYNGAAGGAMLRSIVNTYANPTGGPWPASWGIDQQANDNHAQVEQSSPLAGQVITEDGATFTISGRSFDSFARVIGQTESSSLGYSRSATTTFADDLARWVLSMVTATTTNGITESQVSYDATLDLPSSESAFGRLIARYTWNPNGNLATLTDANNRTTAFNNWYRGVPQQVVHADGTRQSATVNGNGWITSITDENGFATGYAYDLMGRLARITYPSGDPVAWNATVLTFAPVNAAELGIPAGHWKQTIQTGNGVAATYFDAYWRPLVAERYDSANKAATLSQVVTRYDANGRPNFTSYPANTVTSYAGSIAGSTTAYDALGRAVTLDEASELGNLRTTTQYLSGFQTKVTDPRGNSTTTSYQAYADPTRQWPASITAPAGRLTVILRDGFGKPLSVTRTGTAAGSPQLSRYFVYNGYQQLCKRIDPESGASVLAYDAAGNLTVSAAGLALPGTTTCDTATAQGSARRATRTYDARNRITALTFQDHNGDTTWTYTPDGLPATISRQNDNGSGILAGLNAFTYHRRRLLASESSSEADASAAWYTWPVSYGYDANGSVASVTYPSGLYLTYAPNALGQPTQAGSYVSGVSYFPDGQVRQFTFANGIVRTVTENARGLISGITDTGGGVTPLKQSLGFDANANPTAITDAANPNQNRSMIYDGLDRLTSATVGFQGTLPTTYGYDVLDNLTLASQGTRSQTYRYNAANQLSQLIDSANGTTSFGYDAQGNLATRGTYVYNFDYSNRLRGINGQERYRYDGLGRRVWAQSDILSSGRNILSMYGRAGQLLYQQDYRANGSHAFVYLGTRLVATVDYPFSGGSSVRYQHTDAQGSILAETDASRRIIATTVFSSWGGSLNHPNNDAPGYTGHLADATTSLTYMQQRYYDPVLARFLSVDPVDVEANSGGNFNRYWYANNNPYRYTDPDGQEVDGQYHRVLFSAYHLSIRITPDNQAAYKNDPRFLTDPSTGLRYATIGAGPVLDGATRIDLVSAINRPTDADRSIHQKSHDLPISVPAKYKDEDAFIQALFAADANYKDNVSYGLPGGSGYNSNSYINGLLEAVGAEPLIAPVSTPLGNHPLPKEYFEQKESQ